MKLSKTWGIVGTAGAALITIMSFIVSAKLGVVAVIALLILARIIRGPSGNAGIIGVDHVDRQRSSSYGGGFIPGGLLGGSLGTQFGVYGTSVADSSPEAYLKGHRKEYAEERRSVLAKMRRRWLAAAIRKAEARTGHQILVVVGPLEEDRVAKADRVAEEWPSASIVVCIDPVRGTYEVRWDEPGFAVGEAHLAAVGYMMHRSKFAKAITLLAEVLPVQTADAELPDIVED